MAPVGSIYTSGQGTALPSRAQRQYDCRRSAAFFHDGNVDAVIATLPGFVDEGEEPYEPIVIRDHIKAKLAGSRHGKLNTTAVREAARVLAAAGNTAAS